MAKTEKLTYEEAMEQIKASGEKEKQTIEFAEELARIINDLARARVQAHLSQRDLAEKSGIKQSAIARMESLQVVPRLDTVIRIARCLNVQLTINSQKEAFCGNIRLLYSDYRCSTQNRYSLLPWENKGQKESVMIWGKRNNAPAC